MNIVACDGLKFVATAEGAFAGCGFVAQVRKPITLPSYVTRSLFDGSHSGSSHTLKIFPCELFAMGFLALCAFLRPLSRFAVSAFCGRGSFYKESISPISRKIAYETQLYASTD